MATTNDILIPSLTFEEILSDGSTLTNPAADHRRLFLGEDGLFHMRDSAGTITDVGGSGGAVATDTIWDAAGDLVQGTGANTAARLALGTALQVLRVNAGATAAEWAAAAGGQGLVDFDKKIRTSGNVTLNSTSWANVDTGLDIVLTAANGDNIEVGVSAFFGSEAVNAGIDVATIVSAAPVTYASGGAGGAGHFGVQAWLGPDSGHATPVGGSVIFALGAGDISGGTVTLRLRYRTGTAANRALQANSNQPFQWWAKNIGPNL